MAKHSHTVPILTQTDAHVFWKCSESAFPGLREGGREREEEGRGERERGERGRKGEGGEREEEGGREGGRGKKRGVIAAATLSTPALTQWKDSLGPVGELHHEVEHGQNHQGVEEGVAIGHTFFLVIFAGHPPLPLLLVVSARASVVHLLLIWKTITAQQRSLSETVQRFYRKGMDKRTRGGEKTERLDT